MTYWDGMLMREKRYYKTQNGRQEPMPEIPKKDFYSKIILVGEERWSTYAVFNENAFPSELKLGNIIEACSTRSAIFLLHINILKEAVKKNKKDFEKELKKHCCNPSFIETLKNRTDGAKFVAYYDGIDFLSAFHGVFISLKSFLDVYAKLICRTIHSSESSGKILFNRETVGGRKISGGRVINWLNKSAPKSFEHSSSLSKVIEKHSNNWITKAVKYRDDLSHYMDIKGMEQTHIFLEPQNPPFNSRKIFRPMMPDGQFVEDYCSNLLDNLKGFVKDSIIFLPGFKKELINFSEFLSAGHKE